MTPATQAERSAQALLDNHVRKIVDAAPELTDDQRRRLAALLRGGGSDG